MDKVTCGQRPGRSDESKNECTYLGRAFLGRGHREPNGPGVQGILAYLGTARRLTCGNRII